MKFISYAQNFEDVILWRALKSIPKGFYIDVGAWSPDVDSVTRAFYERGWSGINIEPNPEFHILLCKHRPRDENLKVAIDDKPGVLTMNFVSDTGLSTLNHSIAEKHLNAGWELNRQEVNVTTLAAVWDEYVSENQEVHFLKVDVEGFENAALKGNNWEKNRPWIIVVEATLPLSQEESHAEWEPILLEAGYDMVYVDGLNRFYLAKEHASLLPIFKYPPNVFDEFEGVALNEAEIRARDAELDAKNSKVRTAEAEERVDAVEVILHEMRNSRSWRLTAPLRRLFCIFNFLEKK